MVSTSIPVEFEKVSESVVEDTRFQLAKIWLCHTGQNKNNSYFSKESLESAIPSLANLPVLAFIETNSDGEQDFSNHRSELVKENGQYRMKYKGVAYGVIPETNNAKFETKVCSDGVEREFLTVECLLWRKLEDAIDIFDKNSGFKYQSMELDPSYKGYFDKKSKHFVFTDYKFSGACILGSDYEPAMYDACIEYTTNTNFESFVTEINNKFKLFKDFQSQNGTGFSISLNNDSNITNSNNEEGGNDVNKDENLNPEENPAEVPTEGNTPTENTPVDAPTEFSLTNSQLQGELYKALNPNPKTDEWGYTIWDYWYVDSTDTTVLAYEGKTWELVGFEYTMNGDYPVINFDSKKRYKVDYVPMEDGTTTNFNMVTTERAEYLSNVAKKQAESAVNSELETLKGQFTTLNEEVTSLREFKKTTIDTERKQAQDALFASPEFSVLSEEEMNGVREKADTMSIEDLENHLFALVGKKVAKANFSAGPKNKPTKIGIDDTSTGTKSSKPYAHLVEEVRGSKNK